MKRTVLVVLLLLISIGTVKTVSALSIHTTEYSLEFVENQELSIKQAIELAYSSALKWNKKAQLLDAINIDLDKKSEKPIGGNGKRKNWNIAFGVPNTNKFFLVTIHNGKTDKLNDLTKKGDSPYLKKEFIQLKNINYDSPELLKKALEMGSIYPGKNWAKGYNFIISKDRERNITFISIIGWNSDQTKMKTVDFNVKTGEYIPPQF